MVGVLAPRPDRW